MRARDFLGRAVAVSFGTRELLYPSGTYTVESHEDGVIVRGLDGMYLYLHLDGSFDSIDDCDSYDCYLEDNGLESVEVTVELL
jgi:hypothetical protein